MIRLVAFALLAVLLRATSAAPPAFAIATGSQNGTYFQVAHDLVDHVAGPANLSLRVLPSKGSVENVRRLRDEFGTRLALVQSDVYQAFMDQAATGNTEAARIIKPLRVVLPLYDEELHFVVRSDSPLNHVHEIRDKRINIGPVGSGAAMSAATVYRQMFDATMAPENVSTMAHEEALLRLARDKAVDVVVIVAGQPAHFFTGMEPGVEKHFKLLKFDKSVPNATTLAQTYFPATIRRSSYAQWLTEDVPTLAVKTMLVTYEYRSRQTEAMLVSFAQSLCRNFPMLQKDGHPKWRQVNLQQSELPKGLAYYGPTQPILDGCKVGPGSKPAATRPASRCSLDQKLMGFCTD